MTGIGVERAVEEAVRSALGALVAAAPVGDWRPLPVGGGGGQLPDPFRSLLDPGQLFAPDAPPLSGNQGVELPAGFEVPVVQMFDSYIMYEGPDGVIIVDQHSAHERVLYEAVMVSAPRCRGARATAPASAHPGSDR